MRDKLIKRALTNLARYNSNYTKSLGPVKYDYKGVKSNMLSPVTDWVRWLPGVTKHNFNKSEAMTRNYSSKMNNILQIQSKARAWERAHSLIKKSVYLNYANGPADAASGISNLSNTWRYNPILPKVLGVGGAVAGGVYGYKKKGVKGAILGSLLAGLGTYGLAQGSNTIAARLGRV